MSETQKAISIILAKRGRENAGETASQICSLINRILSDAIVSDFEHHFDRIGSLPDEGDRHVIAAAIEAEADLIVTENLRDFPRKKLSRFCIEAVSSDGFIASVIDDHCAIALPAIEQLRVRLNRPDKTTELFLRDIKRAGLAQTVERLAEQLGRR